MDITQLLGDDSSFSNMTAREREVLLQLMSMELDRRENEATPIQLREVVPIKDWLESEYYLGPDAVRVYDYWKDLICNVFDPKRDANNNITEVIISGSIGSGKSTCSEIILMRKIYELSCYKNINALFGLMSKTFISFLYFSVNKIQAERTGFGEIRGWFDSSGYFRDNFPRNPKLDSLIVFPENVMVTFGSGTQHSIGMSMMGSILDEANFFQGESRDNKTVGGGGSKVAELYANIMNRAKSRFVVHGGMDHSLSMLVSSSTTESSFTEKRIAASHDNPHTIVKSPTIWEVKPFNYSGKKFFVFTGNDSLDPYVIKSIDDVNQFKISENLSKCKVEDGTEDVDIIKEEIDKLPEDKKHLFLSVPTELRGGFETDLIQSLQDIGGVSVAPQGRLFTSRPVYNANVRNYLAHPFMQESITVSTGDSKQIRDYLRNDYQFRDIHKLRFLHIDQSTVSDCTGISCVYIRDIFEDNGILKPIISTDFMLRIVPPKAPKKIALYKIRDFVVWLVLERNIRIGKVSYDIFNSEESRQILEEMGINSAYQSVDRTDKAYVDAVTLLYEERADIYDYAPFRNELFTLVHDRNKRKVDHLSSGSKDVSDSWVGAVENALCSTITENMRSGGIEDFLKANTTNMVMGNVGYARDLPINKLIDYEIERQLNSFMDDDGDGGSYLL